jgi:hypothetical protein
MDRGAFQHVFVDMHELHIVFLRQIVGDVIDRVDDLAVQHHNVGSGDRFLHAANVAIAGHRSAHQELVQQDQ